MLISLSCSTFRHFLLQADTMPSPDLACINAPAPVSTGTTATDVSTVTTVTSHTATLPVTTATPPVTTDVTLPTSHLDLSGIPNHHQCYTMPISRRSSDNIAIGTYERGSVSKTTDCIATSFKKWLVIEVFREGN